MKKLHIYLALLAFGISGVAGCQSASKSGTASQSAVTPTTNASEAAPAEAPLQPVAPATPEAASMPSSVGGEIRINAGASSPARDSAGNEWLPDQGFLGGDVIERPDVVISNSPVAVIYQSEHYGMDSFSWKLPNGKYRVNLYFAETYEGITGPGERVFSFNVQGREFKDFDVWKIAGGPMKPAVITTDVTVTDGQFKIKFTTSIENPQINGIEIVPVTASAANRTSQNPTGL